MGMPTCARRLAFLFVLPEFPMTHPVLTALGLSENESGTYLGRGEWSATNDAGVIEPVNPSNGEILGRVQASSQSAAKRYACAPTRCASTRTRSARWSRSRWARSSRKATAKSRK
jgi:hypothetical protein